jgi:hypothetical protein
MDFDDRDEENEKADEFEKYYGGPQNLINMYANIPNSNNLNEIDSLNVTPNINFQTSSPQHPSNLSIFRDINENQNSKNDSIANEDEENERGQKKRFNKGLKMLSVIVKDIVIEKKSTTYKEVAGIILNDSIKQDRVNINTQREIAKEEQNIKRRVYDALNVLISAGILIKEGKRVRKNDNNQKIIISNKRMKSNTLRSKIVS